jgi:Tol biopolymer transport system component
VFERRKRFSGQNLESALANACQGWGFFGRWGIFGIRGRVYVCVILVARRAIEAERSVTLASGSHLGPYEIQAPIGAGAMGEVYRARDPRLGRDVAIKVLPAAFTTDPDRLRRFEQESRAAAALNHPNILTVYDVGAREGVPYVVSELLDGQTLREQLSAGPLSVRKAVEYAVQIAHGLQAAHEQGIVHRDLKPENLLVTSNGRVKILDFGLAKLSDAVSPSDPDGDATHTSITTPGLMMGTVGYMAPEQIRGLPVDHRADIFAFGCILYELLSGRRAFRGDTPADTMMAILKDPPAPIPGDRNVPAALERIVDRCLEKAQAARFQSASDLAFALEGLSSYSETAMPAPGAATPRVAGARWLWALAAVSLVALIAVIALGATLARERRQPAPPAYRSSILPPEHVTFSTSVGSTAGGLALSPDGRRIVFTGFGEEGRVMLWVRTLDGLVAQPLAGTEAAFYPFWSPDSRSIAFFSGGKLKKIDVGGGSPATLCDTPRPSALAAGGTWNKDGVILFAQATMAVYRVSDLGGTPTPVTTLDEARGETQHWAPFFLPDGTHFLYFAAGSKTGGPNDPNGVYVGSLDSQARTLLLPGGSNAKYAAGYLIFPRDRVLVAQKFDVNRLAIEGDAVPIADQISVGGLSGRTGAFSVSETGVLAYQSGFREVYSQLNWMDRNNQLKATLGEQADYSDVELSPDREQAAVSVLNAENRSRDIWTFDVARGTRTRLTLDPTDEYAVAWSPDGKQIVFNGRPKGYLDLYERTISSTDPAQVLLSDAQNNTPTSWSPDGKFLLYTAGAFAVGNTDVWVLPMTDPPETRTPTAFLHSPFNESNARFSPDGKWVAYVSNETGSSEVYVTRFPGPNGKWPISAGGGSFPRWRADGKELFYVARNNKLMAASVNASATDFEVTAAHAVLNIHPPGAATGYQYDVSADGQRFLVNTIVEATALPPITLVVNWPASLQKQ